MQIWFWRNNLRLSWTTQLLLWASSRASHLCAGMSMSSGELSCASMSMDPWKASATSGTRSPPIHQPAGPLFVWSIWSGDHLHACIANPTDSRVSWCRSAVRPHKDTVLQFSLKAGAHCMRHSWYGHLVLSCHLCCHYQCLCCMDAHLFLFWFGDQAPAVVTVNSVK